MNSQELIGVAQAARLHTGRLTSRGSAGHVAEHAVRTIPMSTLPMGAVQSLRPGHRTGPRSAGHDDQSSSPPSPTARRAFGDPHVDEGRPGPRRTACPPPGIPTNSFNAASSPFGLIQLANSRCRHRPPDDGDLHAASCLDPLVERPQRPGRLGRRPGRLDQHAAGVRRPGLGDPPMAGRCSAGQAHPRVEPEMGERLLRGAEAGEVPDRGQDRQ